ncbi:DNA-dependent RNA polymerase auxiliary subunit epsilon [Granulicatella balaenopterae]|uniref:DNA-directed RNA polymerase subunit epsilon n=1 Tax=Granulicatella balaenopterae TaxID=137733 RepID=A0A1H9PKB4_9LACT|nr:DNA-directed RNA polymerase subunit epsilon [Granulicatella balaenopterae]SER48648.1 DNA-dependent RNA polymerase auxiliary subunit epsilon [Granulicatella balaenopterae]
MIFKITYQPNKFEAPRRENTLSLYIEAADAVEARRLIEENTEYNVEFVQELDEKHLAYEQQSADFKLVEF